jgi:hypothetical protein
VTKKPDAKLLTTVELAGVLDAAFRKYNAHLHRGIRTTPIEAYRANPIVPNIVDERHIALALLRRKEAILQKDGVEFRTITHHHVGGTFGHIGEEVIVGYLDTRPDFIHVFDTNHGKEQWLGKLGPSVDAGRSVAKAVVEARKRQIETFERADQFANGKRDEMLVQLRGGIVEDPGSKPVSSPSSKPKSKASEAEALKRRLDRLAASNVWKP